MFYDIQLIQVLATKKCDYENPQENRKFKNLQIEST